MARCLNCIHFDVCDTDRRERARLYGQCSDFLNDADVVPRAEVMRLVGEYYDKCDECRSKIADTVRAEVAREIFEEILNALKYTRFASPLEKAGTLEYIYALKKKYTEEGK